MGKGISDLQRWIFHSARKKDFSRPKKYCPPGGIGNRCNGGPRKAAVGASEYNAAHSSLSRTISRLWQRGLVVIWKNLTGSATGITLTQEGKAMAKAISEEDAYNGING